MNELSNQCSSMSRAELLRGGNNTAVMPGNIWRSREERKREEMCTKEQKVFVSDGFNPTESAAQTQEHFILSSDAWKLFLSPPPPFRLICIHWSFCLHSESYRSAVGSEIHNILSLSSVFIQWLLLSFSSLWSLFHPLFPRRLHLKATRAPAGGKPDRLQIVVLVRNNDT